MEQQVTIRSFSLPLSTTLSQLKYQQETIYSSKISLYTMIIARNKLSEQTLAV